MKEALSAQEGGYHPQCFMAREERGKRHAFAVERGEFKKARAVVAEHAATAAQRATERSPDRVPALLLASHCCAIVTALRSVGVRGSEPNCELQAHQLRRMN